jgi:hypothetical protein
LREEEEEEDKDLPEVRTITCDVCGEVTVIDPDGNYENTIFTWIDHHIFGHVKKR